MSSAAASAAPKRRNVATNREHDRLVVERLEAIEKRQSQHEERDERRFKEANDRMDQVVASVEDLGAKLTKEISGAVGRIQAQVTPLVEEKIQVKAEAKGYLQAKAEEAERRKPNAWAIALAPVIVAALLAGAAGWIGHTVWTGPQPVATSTTTVTEPMGRPLR